MPIILGTAKTCLSFFLKFYVIQVILQLNKKQMTKYSLLSLSGVCWDKG